MWRQCSPRAVRRNSEEVRAGVPVPLGRTGDKRAVLRFWLPRAGEDGAVVRWFRKLLHLMPRVRDFEKRTAPDPARRRT